MGEPVVSIIIPAYNAAPYIEETLRSCLAQTLTSIEIIVVDDGSTDDTAAVVHSVKDPRIQTLSKPNGGVGEARNSGIAAARGAYFQFLDSDDILHPDKLRAHVEALRRYGGRCLGTSAWARFDSRIAEAQFKPAADWKDLSPIEFLRFGFGGGGMMPPNSWLISRDLLGGLRFRVTIDAFEDAVFAAQLAARSERVIFCPDAYSYYRRTPGSLSRGYSFGAVLRFHAAFLEVADIMLQLDDSPATRSAVANFALRLSVSAHAHSAKFGREVERLAHRIGTPTASVDELAGTGGLFAIAKRLLGWRVAAQLRRLSEPVFRARRNGRRPSPQVPVANLQDPV